VINKRIRKKTVQNSRKVTIAAATAALKRLTKRTKMMERGKPAET